MPVDYTLSFRLLGTFEIRSTRADEPIALRRLTRAVVAHLAATNQTHSRQTLMDWFCQEAEDPPRALRSLLSRLRRRIGTEALLTEGNTVRFNPAVGWVDCVEFAQHLEADLNTLPLDILSMMVDLYRGEFLENVSLRSSPEFEHWMLGERARYHQLYQRGLGELIDRLTRRGEIDAAILRAQQLVRSDPLMEEAHKHLMWLYAHNGQREAAIDQFEQCRQTLQRELAVEPTPELHVLRDEIAAGQLSLPLPLAKPGSIWVPTPPERGDFVGRATELSQLVQAWTEVHPGRVSVVLLDAEAGMGKTRLVQEFARTIPEADFLVGECYESARVLAYFPWLEVLEQRLARLDETSLQHLSAFALDYLARLSPAIARRFQRRKPARVPHSGGELSRLFAAIGEFLLELPETPPEPYFRPLILFVDNLQWADDASLQLFHFLARRNPPGKVLLIGAQRTEEADEVSRLQTLLDDLLHHSFSRMNLSPLNGQAITELSTQLWPSLPEGFRPHVCDLLMKATRGNPFFVSEILRELANTAEVPSALPIPKTVQELIRRRLSLFPESVRQVVEALAVLGSPSTPAQLRQTSGRSEEETITAIDLSLKRGLLELWAEAGLNRYDFVHDLMREVVVGQLTPIRRQVLHRRAARSLERISAPAATLAYHWRMAGNDEKEGHFARLAGEQAAAIYANENAIHYLERALVLEKNANQHLHLMEKLGEVWMLISMWDKAEVIFTQTLALAETVRNQRAQARCRVALGRLARVKSDYAAAMAWLEQARADYQALDDQQGVAETLWGMGAVYWSQLDYPSALACFQEQLAMARRLGDRQGIGKAVGSMAVAYTEYGDYAHALTCYSERLQIDLALNDRLSLAKTVGNMGIVYAELGDDAQALICYHFLLRSALELGDRQSVCVAVGNMIHVYTVQGEYAVAGRLSHQAIALGHALNVPLYLCEFLYTSADLLARQNRYAQALALNNEATEMAANIGRTDIQLPARLLSVRLGLAMGDLDNGTAINTLKSLLDAWPEDHEQAAISYELWHLDKSDAMLHQRTAEEYRKLYARTPNITYRRRYEELAGEGLPSPPLLPALPEGIARDPINLESLLAKVEEMITLLLEGSSL